MHRFFKISITSIIVYFEVLNKDFFKISKNVLLLICYNCFFAIQLIICNDKFEYFRSTISSGSNTDYKVSEAEDLNN